MPLSTTRSRLRPTALDVGIGLLSAAVLLVELLLTRIFSVTLYYHLSFLVVSLAMLGLGLGGLMAQLETVRARLDRGIVPWLSLAFAATTVLATLAAFNVRVRLELGTEWGRLAVLYVLCTIPFACAGAAIGLMLSANSERANRLYFFDLVGAALACLVFIPLTNYVGAPTAVLVAAVLGAAAAITLSENNLLTRRAATAVTWGLAALAVANVPLGWYDVRVAKGLPEEPFLAVKWNAFSRVEVLGKDPKFWQALPVSIAGDSDALGPDFRWPLVPLSYDAGASTAISAFDGNPGHLGHLRYRVTAAPHLVGKLDDVLIIGPGGGTDVLTALSMGSSRIVGVEVNPLTVELMRTRFRTFSGRIYDGYPGVRIVVDEGRSYVRASRERYDLIQASLVDTWAASAAGAHALTENSLYTVEAFEDYLAHLKPDGMVAFSRWFSEPPVETLRVVGLAAEALRKRGEAAPGAHIFMVRSKGEEGSMPSLATVLVKRSEFDSAELDKLHAWAAEMGFPVAYSPRLGPTGADPFHQMLDAIVAQTPDAAPFGVSLVDDDRPFFFSRVSVGSWLKSQASGHPLHFADMALAEQNLLGAWSASFICLVLLLAAPLVGTGTRGEGRGLARSTWWDAYFVCLGVGFIAVEVVLIQRLGLFLGYPTRALAVVMFTLLLSSGVGSLWAQRLEGLGGVRRPLLLLCALLAAAAEILPPLSRALLGAGIAYKILAVVALVAPLGFMMGVPFASGIRHAAREATTSVPRAWAVNGVASVFGSCLTTAVAMSFGFTVSLLCGAAAYAAAWVCALKLTSVSIAHPPGIGAPAPALAGESGAGPSRTGLPVSVFCVLVALWIGLSVTTTAKAKQEREFLPPVGQPLANWSMVTAAGIEFGAGWFDVERSREGRSWRWMGAKASLRLPNRHRDAKLSLKGWMPRAERGPTPALHIFINGDLLADVETELVFTHELVITKELQGQAEQFDVTLATSTTVRPGQDPRDLGLCLDEIVW